jgi:hypothetical protein
VGSRLPSGPPKPRASLAWSKLYQRYQKCAGAGQLGMRPDCCIIPAMSSRCHVSMIWPVTIRYISMYANVAGLPVAGWGSSQGSGLMCVCTFYC